MRRQNLTFNASEGTLGTGTTVLNLVNTVQVYTTNGLFTLYDQFGKARTFSIVQFLIRAPSEHTFSGQHYDVELQVIHKEVFGVVTNKTTGNTTTNTTAGNATTTNTTAGNKTTNATNSSTSSNVTNVTYGSAYGVLSIFFDRTAGGKNASDFIDSLGINNTNKNTSWQIKPNSSIPLQKLIDTIDKKQMYYYEGSMSIPPCTENTNWIIVDNPQPISEEQVQLLNDRWKNNQTFAGGRGNNRDTHPLNGRDIYFTGSTTFASFIQVGALALLGIFSLYF